jgi:ATP-binding cassette subfamily B protein
LPRVNLLHSLVADPGPAAERLPGSSGEAVSRFRDDTMNLALVLDVWLDISGASVAALSAIAVMAGVDWRVTLVVALPVAGALVLCRELGHRLRRLRRLEREATAAVTGFIGDTFGGITAVKAAGAERAVERRFDELGQHRAEAARRDQIITQMLQTLSGVLGNLGIGVTLLLLAPAMARGEVTVGDIGLFAASITVLANLPRWAAALGAYQRQADVSVERLTELLPAPSRDPYRVVDPAPTFLRDGPGPYAPVPVGEPGGRVDGDRLERLDVRGLKVRHAGGTGLDGVDLTLTRGTLTVLTGPVGSGKSTLLRAVLGLVAGDAGAVAWNGRVVGEPSTWLVPPRVAYLPQVPRLFSEPLADTVLLGVERSGLAEAIRLASLEDDLATMPDGLGTVVGPKGVRLSGGQIQRTAAARAFVRRPELLVVDDLSSALDVETESRVWDRLLDTPGYRPTLLIVTHRPRVLERADQVVVLDRGIRVA